MWNVLAGCSITEEMRDGDNIECGLKEMRP